MTERLPLVGVIMGSKSDWDTMRHAADILRSSACRTSAASCRRIGRRPMMAEYAVGARRPAASR